MSDKILDNSRLTDNNRIKYSYTDILTDEQFEIVKKIAAKYIDMERTTQKIDDGVYAHTFTPKKGK
jgi:hypothetical protein